MSETAAKVRLLEAKEHILDGRQPSTVVRPDIASSWHRSRMCGVDPIIAFPMFKADVRTDSRLTRVADIIVDHHGAPLDQSCTSLQLTDPDGVILRRWVPDRALARRLGLMGVEPGFSFDEASAGTNSTGITLETRAPAKVVGAEHYSEQYAGMACYGVPLNHPVTRRFLGVLNLTCSEADANAFQEPWLAGLAQDIQRALSDDASGRRRRLMQEFMVTPAGKGASVVAIDDDIVICNPQALRSLRPEDHATLWSMVPAARTEPTRTSISLSSGEADVNIRSLDNGDRVAGAVLRIRPRPSRAAPPSAAPSGMPSSSPRSEHEGGPHPLGDLAGRSRAWMRVREAAGRAAGAPSCIVVGEPGSGASAVAGRLAGSAAAVQDCRLQAGADQPNAWVAAVVRDVCGRGQPLLLEHVEALDARSMSTLAAAMECELRQGQIVATRAKSQDEGVHAGDGLSDLFAVTIALPSLADRLEDIPDLVQSLTEQHLGAVQHSGAQAPRWGPSAVHALARQSWRRNIATLGSVVRQVLSEHRGGEITVDDLPVAIRSRASRRVLTGLESAESRAITQALADSGRNKVAAAAALGIARSTLYRRIRELGLDLESADS